MVKFTISRFIISRFECITICPDPSYLNLLTFWSRKSQKSWVKHIKSQEKSTTFILQLWNMTWLVFNDTTHVTKKRAELNSMIFLCLQKIIMIIFSENMCFWIEKKNNNNHVFNCYIRGFYSQLINGKIYLIILCSGIF